MPFLGYALAADILSVKANLDWQKCSRVTPLHHHGCVTFAPMLITSLNAKPYSWLSPQVRTCFSIWRPFAEAKEANQ